MAQNEINKELTAGNIAKNYKTPDEIVETNDKIFRGSVVIDEKGTTYNYFVYLPDNNGNVVADVHYHGYKASTNPYPSKYELNYYDKNTSKTLGIVMDNDFYRYDNNGEILDLVVSQIENDCNVKVVRVNADANSYGGLYAIDSLAEYNYNHNIEEPNFISLYGATEMERKNNAPNIDEEILKKGLEHTYLLMYGNMPSTTKRFGDIAAGIIRIENPTYIGGNAHDNAPIVATNDNAVDFMSGYGDLYNVENYTFEKYNQETGEYEEIGYDEVKALIPGLTDEDIIDLAKQAYTDDTILKFDSEFLENNVGIIEEKKTNLESVANGLKEEGYASTTLSPKVENDIINTIKSKITSSVEEINALIQESKSIGESKDDLEQKELELVEMLDIGHTSFMDEYKG